MRKKRESIKKESGRSNIRQGLLERFHHHYPLNLILQICHPSDDRSLLLLLPPLRSGRKKKIH